MLRHFSTIRASIVSLAIPICLTLGGAMVKYTDDILLLAYLSVVEFIVYLYAFNISKAFSLRIQILTVTLMALEDGERRDPHKIIDTLELRRKFKPDFFDRLILRIGVIFHLGLYAYILAHFALGSIQ